MGNSWDEFVTNVNSDGRAISCLFEWILPPVELLPTKPDFKLKSASLPESTVEELSTYFMGQQYRAGGARRFNDWTVTIMCDNNGFLTNIRSLLEIWMHEINTVGGIGVAGVSYLRYGIGESGMDSPMGFDINSIINSIGSISIGYYRPQILRMLDNDNEGTLSVALIDSWPKSIGPISLDHSSADWAQFDVTFGYQYHVIGPGSLTNVV